MCVSICFTISCHLSLFQLQFKFNYQNTYSRIIPNLETYIYEGKTFMILLQFDIFHSSHLWRQNWNYTELSTEYSVLCFSFFFLSWDHSLRKSSWGHLTFFEEMVLRMLDITYLASFLLLNLIRSSLLLLSFRDLEKDNPT